MTIKKITAIIRAERMNSVEERLKSIKVPGISLTRVTGYGEYAEYFNADWCVSHARIEIFVPDDQVQAIVETITESAATGLPGDGIIAVLPVESLRHIRNGCEPTQVDSS